MDLIVMYFAFAYSYHESGARFDISYRRSQAAKYLRKLRTMCESELSRMDRRRVYRTWLCLTEPERKNRVANK
jgi:hypothetical protein